MKYGKNNAYATFNAASRKIVLRKNINMVILNQVGMSLICAYI